VSLPLNPLNGISLRIEDFFDCLRSFTHSLSVALFSPRFLSFLFASIHVSMCFPRLLFNAGFSDILAHLQVLRRCSTDFAHVSVVLLFVISRSGENFARFF
jgi:hypothetical protein